MALEEAKYWLRLKINVAKRVEDLARYCNAYGLQLLKMYMATDVYTEMARMLARAIGKRFDNTQLPETLTVSLDGKELLLVHNAILPSTVIHVHKE